MTSTDKLEFMEVNQMKQVTSDEFFQIIGPLDVVLNVVGNHPYKTLFKLRNGNLVGVQDHDGTYYLTN